MLETERGDIRSLTQDDCGHHKRAESIVDRFNCRLDHSRCGRDCTFDLGKFNSVAPHLNLTIHSPSKMNLPVLPELAKITRPVSSMP